MGNLGQGGINAISRATVSLDVTTTWCLSPVYWVSASAFWLLNCNKDRLLLSLSVNSWQICAARVGYVIHLLPLFIHLSKTDIMHLKWWQVFLGVTKILVKSSIVKRFPMHHPFTCAVQHVYIQYTQYNGLEYCGSCALHLDIQTWKTKLCTSTSTEHPKNSKIWHEICGRMYCVYARVHARQINVG